MKAWPNPVKDYLQIGLYCFDTTGKVLWEKEYEQPEYPGMHTTFWLMNDFKHTSDGHWLMLSSVYAPATNGDMLLTKLDKDFNVIWHIRYGDNCYKVPGRGLETADGNYLIAGSRDNMISFVDYPIITQVQFYKTDTAGNVLGQWRSDSSQLHSFVRDLIPTSDGGYIYTWEKAKATRIPFS